MNENTDDTDALESSTEQLDATVEVEAAEHAEPESEDNTSFVLLAVALLVLVGGSVYFVGQLMSAKNETAAAQDRAEAIIADFDPNEFTSEFSDDELSPSSLPLVDESDVEPIETPSTTAAPEIARPSVDPSTIAIAFINRVPGEDYGKVGYIDRAGERQMTELECERLDLNGAGGICLDDDGLSGDGLVLNASMNPTTRFGISDPSRATVSPDGSIVAWTGFSLGHDYLNPGELATTTQLISLDMSIAVDLERNFGTFRNGEAVSDIDRNYWGVTFADNNRFYATLGIGEETFIVEGEVQTSRMDVVFENATCPEVSPDGSTIVAKEQRGDHFQLIAIDVATGNRRDLGETRSVDDQVEWIDDNSILYGVVNPEEGTDAQPVLDIYVLNVSSGAEPRLLIPFADSPAAI